MINDPDCIFCKIVAGDIPCFKLYEDDATIAFMDINPVNPGHALIVHKAHHKDLFEIPADNIASVTLSAQKVAKAVQTTLKPAGMNLLQCNGSAAKQSVMHFHMHVIPRHIEDGLTMNWELVQGDLDKIGALAERIRGIM
ncbi:MAG: HIT family protein [Proteobacteria bacterium]|nr:HIT family protein [Pseudomonadota bacterium]